MPARQMYLGAHQAQSVKPDAGLGGNRIWCGTYNVNDQYPKSAAEIQDWVQGCGDAELLVFSYVHAFPVTRVSLNLANLGQGKIPGA